jgi:hypothetical protein
MPNPTSHSARLKSWMVVGAVCGVLALGWGLRKWTEPRFHGRGIRSWIEQLPYDQSSNSESQEAMRFFGERAVPYLIEAVVRPGKWENGLLAKIPPRYLQRFIDLADQGQVRLAAIWQLKELMREEIDRNELELAPKYPVLDRVLPVLRSELRQHPGGPMLTMFDGIEPYVTSLAPELRPIFAGLVPNRVFGSWDWFAVGSVLAETHDPDLVSEFLRYSGTTNFSSTGQLPQHAFQLLARNGQTNAAVQEALRLGLASTNLPVSAAAIQACAELNLCTAEALSRLTEWRLSQVKLGPREAFSFDLLDPFLRWRANTNDSEAVTRLEVQLDHGPPWARMMIPMLLAKAGRDAKRFVPALVGAANQSGAPFQIEAVRALRIIDPEKLKEILPTIPRSPRMHATQAGPAR